MSNKPTKITKACEIKMVFSLIYDHKAVSTLFSLNFISKLSLLCRRTHYIEAWSNSHKQSSKYTSQLRFYVIAHHVTEK